MSNWMKNQGKTINEDRNGPKEETPEETQENAEEKKPEETKEDEVANEKK